MEPQNREFEEIEICDFPESGYAPVLDYGEWRAAVLKYCEDTTLEKITYMQKHEESDELFVLLTGSCTLYTAGAGETPEKIKAVPLTPGKGYNVKRGVWHNHVLDEKGMVFIVENRNTCDENSPCHDLTNEQIGELKKL